jgi:hypothetical protein
MGGERRGVGAAGAVRGAALEPLARDLDEPVAVEEEVGGLVPMAAREDDARGSSRALSASWASSSRSRAPLSATMTGSSTTGASPTRSSASPTASIVSLVPSMPTFTASTPMSSTTARTCSTTTSPGIGCTAVTATVF